MHEKHLEKMGCRDEKKNFQWHSGNYVKIATPAEFEYQIPYTLFDIFMYCHFMCFEMTFLCEFGFT